MPALNSTAMLSTGIRSGSSFRTFRDNLSEIFPDRKDEVPKTLVFAKTDLHAEDVVEIVRTEFGKERLLREDHLEG